MIRAIVVFDSKQGIADAKGIPWHLPNDVRYFRSKTRGALILLGTGFYDELPQPLPDRVNYVLTHKNEPLREGFKLVHDLDKFLAEHKNDNLWIVGGANLYEQTVNSIQELYITRVEGDFHCTKFFPAFEDKFKLTDKSSEQLENNIKYRFEVWRANSI